MNTITHELLRAVADGDINRVRALLATGADPNSTNNAHQTALMLAAAFKRSDIVSLLIKAGASVDIEDELGLAPIDWANNDAAIVALLNSVVEKQPLLPLAEPAIETTMDQPPTPRARGTERIPDAPALTGLAAAILRDHKPKAGTVAPLPIPLETEPESEVEPESVPDTQYLPEESSADDTLDKKVSSTAAPVTEDTLSPAASRSSRGRIFAIDSAYDTPEPRRKVEIAVPASPKKGGAGKLIFTLVLILGVISFGAYYLVKYLSAKSATVTNAPPETIPSPAISISPVPTPSVVQQTSPEKSAPVVRGNLAGTELYLAEAEYPAGAQQSGTVTVKVRASQKGIVVAASAIDGDEAFRSAAERAARNSAFSPDELEGKGASVEGTIKYTFVAPQGQSSSPPAVVRNEVIVTTGGPLAGTERKLVKPEYPASARRDGISGKVTIVVRVNALGRVVSARPLDGPQDLRAAAVKVVRESIFIPAKHRANTDVVGTITYTFR